MLTLANMSNGLAFPPYDYISYFQSNHGHNAKIGYFDSGSMPYSAIVHLLRGGEITIVDATRRRKPLTDAQKFGIPTWCLVFNRAVGQFDKSYRKVKVCAWQTPEMLKIAHSDTHKSYVQTIRKFIKLFGYSKPAVIGDNVFLVCHQAFIGDDKPKIIQKLM